MLIGSEKGVGIVPRAIDEVADLIELDQEGYAIRVSCLKIYHEPLDLITVDQGPNLIIKIHEILSVCSPVFKISMFSNQQNGTRLIQINQR